MTYSRSTEREFSLRPIGTVRSPYGQKFAVPRQGLIAGHTPAYLVFDPPYDTRQAFKGLEGFSHLYVLFIFHQVPAGPFKSTVRPPRLGGNTRLGVFATRSPFRPSRLGLSLVRLEEIEETAPDRVRLRISGADILDGTPIVDIKPYIPFVDCIPGASGGFASSQPSGIEVVLSPEVRQRLTEDLGDRAVANIIEILSQDPRPAYKGAEDGKDYYARLYGYDLRFRVEQHRLQVVGLVRIESGSPDWF